MNHMKTFLPWLCALALLGAAAFFFSGNRKLSAEVAALRAESAQAEALRAEVEQLKTSGSPAQGEEIARLRKNTEELLKLRNELQQLRGEKKDLTQKAQAAQAQAQAAQAQAQAAHSQVASISTNIQALTAQALSEQQKALAARYGVQPLTAEQILNGCINNLRQLDGAKQQWALENRKTATVIPAEQDVAAYLKNGIPKCPGGGAYTLHTVGDLPACSVAGHALSQ